MRVKLLDQMKEMPPGLSKTQMATQLGISRRTQTRPQEGENAIRADLNMGKQKGKKRKREGKDSEVEEALKSWFTNVRQHQQTVTCKFDISVLFTFLSLN